MLCFVMTYQICCVFIFTERTSSGRRFTFYVGQTATIPCHPRVTKDVDWRYRATETGFEDYIYSNGVMYERFRDRMTVVKSDDGDYDLIIGSVNVTDAGIYICIENLGIGTGYVNHLMVSGNWFYLLIVVAVLCAFKDAYSSLWEPISELWDVTCHMGSLSVTYHPTQVNAPTTPASQAGTRFTYPGGMEG